MAIELKIRSYAKINWWLDVLFRREDGYHELRTIYQTVSLYDRIHLIKTSGKIEVTCDDARVPSDETNLAYRAAAMLREAAGIESGARIEIEKRIPVAAGLGGGSSNAAVSLLGLARLWDARIDERALHRLAAGLGSDVPFFLSGGTALGTGRGEEIHPVEDVECENLLLANPGIAVSTADAYGRLSRLTRPESARIIPFALPASKGNRVLPLSASNDFEEAVLPAYPEVAELKRRLLDLGAERAVMSGSGATVFGVFDNRETCERARYEVRATGCWAERVRAINRQEYNDLIFE